MKLSNFDYYLPKNLIAQEPTRPRDHSWLLLLDKNTGEIKDKRFYDICDYLQKGDVVVVNNSKVFPARLIGKRKGTGGKVEVFLLRRRDAVRTTTHPALRAPLSRGDLYEVWQCLVGGSMRKEGLEVEFMGGLKCGVLKNNDDGTFDVEFNGSGDKLMNIVNKIGRMPLPPYIKRGGGCRTPKGVYDTENYQTVYADKKKIGSAAAPTAGFHFTPELIKKLKKKGVKFEYITLHVGLGTFAPVKVDDITKHKMHAEWVEVRGAVLGRITKAKKDGRRIIAVGTTSVRTLEAVWEKISGVPISAVEIGTPEIFRGWVNIFIYPGYKFKVVDGIITNFHLPKSTLLMLVSAFAGKSNIDKAYRHAIKYKYKFYSYGDAMLII